MGEYIRIVQKNRRAVADIPDREPLLSEVGYLPGGYLPPR